MNSQVTQESSLPFGVDLDDDVTVKLWNDGSITCIKYGGIGEQDEVPISKEGVAELVAWLNKHAVEHRVHLTASGAGGRGQNSLQSSFIADDPSATRGGR